MADALNFALPKEWQLDLSHKLRIGLIILAVIIAQFLAYRDQMKNLAKVIEEKRDLTVQLNKVSDELRVKEIALASRPPAVKKLITIGHWTNKGIKNSPLKYGDNDWYHTTITYTGQETLHQMRVRVTFDQPIEELLKRDSSGAFNAIPKFHTGSKTENPEDQSNCYEVPKKREVKGKVLQFLSSECDINTGDYFGLSLNAPLGKGRPLKITSLERLED